MTVCRCSLWPAKCVIAFYCSKKLLSLQTDIQRSQHSLKALKSVACSLWFFCTGPGQNRETTTTELQNHCNSASLRCFRRSLILRAQSYVTEDAGLGWMKTSMWKTIFCPWLVPKISQSRKDTTVPLKNERGPAVLWSYPQQSKSESSCPNSYWVVLTSHNW